MEFQEQPGIYQQIADHVCAEILRGKWEANARIPSVRELAAQIAVNPNTVMRSYTQLEDMGILFNRRGVGFFVDQEARHRIIAQKRREFLTRELPQIFRQMELLGISFDELEKQYLTRGHAESPPRTP